MNRKKTPPDSLLRDYGDAPAVLPLARLCKINPFFRTAIWTGRHLQVTLMTIRTGGEIGLESHPELDQMLYIESGRGSVRMGKRREELRFRQSVSAGDAVLIPAGTWHNLLNTGGTPLKLFSVYAPPQHPYGTVHETKESADAAENSGQRWN